MKNYKMLFPIVLIGFSALSVYQLFSQNLSNTLQYNDDLSNARYCASVGIVDASKYYEKALEVKKDINVYAEYVNFYINQGDYKSAEEVANTMVDTFPQSSQGYDLLMTIYDANEDYNSLFSIYKKTQNKKVGSASIDEAYKKNEYQYYDSGKNFAGVKDEMNGYYAVMNDKGNWGYVNEKGRKVVNCQYLYAGGFSSEMASVTNKDNELYYVNSEDGKKFVFDSDISYEYLGQVTDEMYAVRSDGSYAYYDKSFNKKFGDFQYAGTFNFGIAAVQKDNKWMLINKSGDIISDEYDEILFDDNDIACVNKRVISRKNNVYYILNENGNVVKETDYQEIAKINSDGFIAYKKDDKWGFCDSDGTSVIDPQFDDAKSFSNNLAAVCKNDKWGYITKDCEIAIDYTFYDALAFNKSGCTFVSDKDDSWEMINLYKYNY